jgi:hypothetical protein
MARSKKLESGFQDNLCDRLEFTFPGCFITKLDTSYKQGIPDLLILFDSKWAILECKESASAAHQPNQDHYVEMFDYMSFSRFIYPENEDRVIGELYNYFMYGER